MLVSRSAFRSSWCAFSFFALTIALHGCGNGNAGGGKTSSGVAPAIVTQPQSTSVPMGLTAQFVVGAQGSPLNYQWYLNGSAIAGATASAYTTPAAQFSDTNESFTVTVSNALGSVTSNAATLTVTARAPQPGDLRFQWVDSPATVRGVPGGGEGTNIGDGVAASSFGDSTGTPLSVGPGCPPAGGQSGFGCSWGLDSYPLPLGLSGVTTWYQYFALGSGGLSAELDTLSSANAVVTGIDIEPATGIFAASWVQPSTPIPGADDPWGPSDGAFTVTQNSVAPAGFAAAAAQEGANGRVITAVSWMNGQILYLAYGWTLDTATAYDVTTAAANFDTVTAVAQQMAASGYIITAVGGTQYNGLWLVGTRVHGDSLPRPFQVFDANLNQNADSALQSGYPIVAFLVGTGPSAQNYWLYMNER